MAKTTASPNGGREPWREGCSPEGADAIVHLWRVETPLSGKGPTSGDDSEPGAYCTVIV